MTDQPAKPTLSDRFNARARNVRRTTCNILFGVIIGFASGAAVMSDAGARNSVQILRYNAGKVVDSISTGYAQVRHGYSPESHPVQVALDLKDAPSYRELMNQVEGLRNALEARHVSVFVYENKVSDWRFCFRSEADAGAFRALLAERAAPAPVIEAARASVTPAPSASPTPSPTPGA